MNIFDSVATGHRSGMAGEVRVQLTAKANDEVSAFPLSPAQQRMFEALEESPENPAFNLAFRWMAEGELDPALLDRAVQLLIQRHEILRARIMRLDNKPAQLISPTVTIQVPMTDMRGLPESQRDAEMNLVCAQEARQSFDVSTGPLIRIRLLRLQERRHVLMLTVHHIIADGWSVGVMTRDLQAIYAGLVKKQRSVLTDLPLQYPDYVIWQQERLAEGGIQEGLSFWREQLANYVRLEVPADFPRLSSRTTASDIKSAMMPVETVNGLTALIRKHGGTMFSTTLAACMVLLHRYAGMQDIAIGSALAGRNRAEVEGIVGLFVNQFVLRNGVQGSDTFADLAGRVRDRVWDVVANQDVPFELVIKALESDDKPWSDPFFSVNFNCYRAYGDTSNIMPEHGALHLTPIPSASQGALYDLNFFLIERDGRWRVSLEYNTDLYRSDTAERLVEAFCSLLAQVVKDPNRRIADISLDLSAPAEKTSEAGCDNASGAAHDGDVSSDDIYAVAASPAQQRFWLLTKVNPGSTAFSMPSTVHLHGSLSIPHLAESFNLLVRRHEILRTTFREIEGELLQIISPVVNVPLETSNLGDVSAEIFRERVQKILHDEAEMPFDLERGPLIRARIIRMNDTNHILVIVLHHILADGWSSNIVQREIWSAYEAMARGILPSLPPLEIQYADFAAWQRDWLESKEARDQLEFWMTRLGGTLPVIDFPTDHRPSGRPAKKSAIESILLSNDLVADVKAFCKGENATLYMVLLACFSILLSRYSLQDDVIIGSPVAKRRPETEPLIGPFAGPIALRFDLSGDLTLRQAIQQSVEITIEAMSNSAISFEWLFDKLKIRTRRGRNPLFQFYFFYQVAFLQARVLQNLTVTPMPTMGVGTPFELQLAVIERDEHLKANLEYNPELFDATTIQGVLRYYEQILRAVVATPDLHLRALSQPVRNDTPTKGQVARQHVAPRNANEAMVARIWEKVLEVPAISVTDDFFDIGGTSILAARLMLALEKEMGVRLDLSSMLVAPSVEQLTRKILSAQQGDVSQIVPLRTSGSKVPLFCIHGGGGHVLHYRALTSLLNDDQPVYGLQAPDLDGGQRKMTVEQLAALYLSDVRRIQKRGPYQLCGLSFGGLVAYEMASQLVADGEEVGLIALFDTGNPAFYRNLSPQRSGEFRSTYLRDRIRKYAYNLMWGNLGAAIRDIRQLIGSRVSVAAWKAVRQVSQFTGRPIPRIIRSNFIMFLLVGRSYVPKPYPGAIHLFRAQGRTAEYLADVALGWEEIAAEGVKVHYVSGGHVTMMEKPHIACLVEQIQPLLAGGC